MRLALGQYKKMLHGWYGPNGAYGLCIRVIRFKNISADLMIGLPGQTKKQLLNDAKTLLELGINHISTYMLQLEEKAPLTRLIENGEIKVPSEDKCVSMYEALASFLKKQELFFYKH